MAGLDQDVAKEFASYIAASAQNNTSSVPAEKIREVTRNASHALDTNTHKESAAKVSKNLQPLTNIASYDSHNWGAN